MKFFNQKERVVFTHLEKSFLGDSKELILAESHGVGVVVEGEWVEVDEDGSCQPEEGEGIELEGREEGEPQHFDKVLIFRFDLPVEETTGERCLPIIYFRFELFHIYYENIL